MEETENEKKDVTIYIDQRAVTLPQGKYSGSDLKMKGGVPEGNLLFRIAGSERIEVADDQPVEIHDGEKFVSAPPVGGAS